MLFAFHLARGKWTGCSITVYRTTATKAIASLRRMTHPGCTPRITLRDVDTCFVGETMNHSPTNVEMVQAAESVASYFWRELRQRVDVTVEILENN